jgi:hypothetical protein
MTKETLFPSVVISSVAVKATQTLSVQAAFFPQSGGFMQQV